MLCSIKSSFILEPPDMLLLFIIFILKLLSSPAFLFSWSNTLFILTYFSLSGCLASLDRLFSLLPQRGLGFVIEGPQWEQSPRNRKALSVYPLGGNTTGKLPALPGPRRKP